MDPVLANFLWAALLGLALGAMLGVLLAATGKKRRHEQAERRAWLASFRYVLSEDPEGAEVALSEVAAEARGGAESSLALGALLRRKGEYGRAIRIHERLMENGRLAPRVRQAAAWELALDFRKAGLVSRAAETLEALLARDPDHRDALRELREISTETQAWGRAIELEDRLEGLGLSTPAIRAHLLAGQARDLLASCRSDEARRAAEEALASDPASADGHLALGEILRAQGDRPGAIQAFGAAIDRIPELLPSVQPTLEALFLEKGEVAGLGLFLGERLRHAPDDPWLRLALARHLHRRGHADEAIGILRAVLRTHPHHAETRHELGRLLLEAGTTEALRNELKAIFADFVPVRRPFACERCEMELLSFAFRCPRCCEWDSVRAGAATAPAAASATPLPAMVASPPEACGAPTENADRRTGT